MLGGSVRPGDHVRVRWDEHAERVTIESGSAQGAGSRSDSGGAAPDAPVTGESAPGTRSHTSDADAEAA
jgi:hypothetical protein